jgi:VWFA-related protein
MQRSVLALLCSAVLAVSLAAQQPAPPSPPRAPEQPDVRFKVEINYVEVDAVVTDAQGNFIRDLGPEDFEVLEDGKPQEVTAFSLVDIPIERADRPLFAPPTVVPDVRSNAREFNGRIYLILLDDLHTAPLRSLRVKAAARTFIERYLGANDLAAVVVTSGRTDASQGFTSNRSLLLRAVDKFMGRKLRSAVLEKYDEYQRRRGTPLAGDPLKDPADFERGYQARSMLTTLKRTSEWMSGIRGRRKAVVLIGEGIDYDIHNVFEGQYASSILDDTREAIAAATRANVALYTVDPRGLTLGADEAMELGAPPEDQSLRLDTVGLQNEIRTSQDSLRVLADETGGVALINTNNVDEGFSRIVQDNSSYYLLGFYSNNTRRDGKFRKITVRVRRPGLEVRARKGYAAPRGRPATPPKTGGVSADLSDALASPIPASGLPMRVFAAPFKGGAPNAAVLVAVEMDGQRLGFKQGQSTFDNKVELWIAAVNDKGDIKDVKSNTVNLTLRPQTYQSVAANGLRVTQRLEVPPGRYQIRVGARDAGGGAVGTVSYDLEIPDFYKAPLAMSGVVITSAREASIAPTINPDAELKDVLPAQPVAQREFLRGDTLAIFAEVYDTQGATPHKVDITSAIKADGGRAVATHSEERGSEELQGRSGGFGFRADFPLKDLPPGEYVLSVEARSRLSGNPTVRQDIPFRIREAS